MSLLSTPRVSRAIGRGIARSPTRPVRTWRRPWCATAITRSTAPGGGPASWAAGAPATPGNPPSPATTSRPPRSGSRLHWPAKWRRVSLALTCLLVVGWRGRFMYRPRPHGEAPGAGNHAADPLGEAGAAHAVSAQGRGGHRVTDRPPVQGATASAAVPWHAMDPNEVLQRLSSSEHGLGADDRRRAGAP